MAHDPLDYRLNHRAMVRDFDAAAAHYEKAAILQRTVAERLIEHLDPIRIAPLHILDLGSGSGLGARMLARRYPKAIIFQLDSALEMLRVARRYGPRLFSRHRYLRATAEALPFAAGSFDMVFSNLMLQWCDELDLVLAEIARVLRRDGLLIFSTLGPDTLKELRQSWAEADDRVHVHAFLDMHDVGDALIRAGLKNPVMEMERIRMTYADCHTLMRDLKQLGAQNVSLGRRRTLTGKRRLERMIAAYERFREHGRLPATFEIVYGHAFAGAPAPSREVAFPIAALRSRLRVAR